MIAEFTSVDMASRQRYASNLLGFIVESLEESAQKLPHVSLEQPDAAQFRIQSASDAIEIEANNPIGSVALRHSTTSGTTASPAHSGVIELSECRYPWDFKIAFTGCEWLGLDPRESTGAPSPSLNERGAQIVAAIINKFFDPDERVY